MRILLIIAVAAVASGCTRTVVVQPLQNVSVRGFVLHADREWPGTPEQQALTADTLDWFASAIQSLATTRQLTVRDLPTRMQEFQSALKEFSAGDSKQVQQAVVLQRLFSSGADLVADVAAAAGLAEDAGDDVSNVRRAAESLDENRLPSQQPDVIEAYFREASRLLQRVDRGA
jgi:hypothetical protein